MQEKILFTPLIFLTTLLPAFSAPLRVMNDDSAGLYSTPGKCTAGNCISGQGEMIFATEIRYAGNWQASVPHGIGTLSKGTTVLYAGIWRNGKFWGKCLSGNCENGIGAIELSGCIVKIENTRFQSSRICAGNEMYSGFFKNYMKHGRGFVSGVTRIETGEYVNDRLNGYCEFMTLNGFSYRGTCLNNNVTGIGKMVFGTGGGRYKSFESFEGEFLSGQPLRGTLKLRDGRVFTGEWLSPDRIRGVIIKNGKTQKGEWDDDVLDETSK